MSDQAKWKHALLSSGLPLEMETANQLVSTGFTVQSDFNYSQSSEERTELDLHALSCTPFKKPDEPDTSRVELLIACRQTGRDRAWIFAKDPNAQNLSPVKPEYAIRVVDHFSPWVLKPDKSFCFDKTPACMKGIEIDMKTGQLFGQGADRGFKSDIEKLRNAIPPLLADNAIFYMSGQPEQNIPFFFCPILLTDANLFIMRDDSSVSNIESADHIHEAADPTPFLILHSDYDLKFKSFCTDECTRMKVLQRSDKCQRVEQKRARYFQRITDLPFYVIDALVEGLPDYMNRFFTHFIICQHTWFPELADTIKKKVESVVENRISIE